MRNMFRNGILLGLKRNLPTILTCVGAAGVAVTAVMAVKATPKAMRLLESAKAEKGEDLTKLEIAWAAGPAYIPAAAIGLSAIACILGANALSKRHQAAITSAYIMLDRAYRAYRDKTRTLLGEDADVGVREAIVRDRYEERNISMPGNKQVFYEEFRGEFFERTKEEVLSAEYRFNRNFALRGYASLNEFYDFLDLPHTEAGETLGWSLEAGEFFYGYSWVDFEHRPVKMDDELDVLSIETPFPPTADYLSDF